MTDEAVKAAADALRLSDNGARSGWHHVTCMTPDDIDYEGAARVAVEAARPHIEADAVSERIDELRAENERLREERDTEAGIRIRAVSALQEIAGRRCLSEGPCAPHGHPQCIGGSCVTCRARAALDDT